MSENGSNSHRNLKLDSISGYKTYWAYHPPEPKTKLFPSENWHHSLLKSS